MSNTEFFVKRAMNKHAALRSGFLRKFGRDEDGSIIILTLVLLITMLILGGMAVDFMRFESRRALLQSVSDRAVLAAAKLDQTLDPEDVVIDYFAKSGFDGAIIGQPDISAPGSSRSVAVRSEIDVSTFYLKFLGIDELSAPASSTAIEGLGSVEVSLIVDLSGSMGRSFVFDSSQPAPEGCEDLTTAPTTRYIWDSVNQEWARNDDGTYATYETKTRIQALRDGARCFVRKLISVDTAGQATVSLVPYSSHVNAGPAIFNALDIRTTRAASATLLDPIITDPDTALIDQAASGLVNPSTCIEFTGTEPWDTTEFDAAQSFMQAGNYQTGEINSRSSNYWTSSLCRLEVENRIIPISDNEDALMSAIAGMQPGGQTAIYQGMKWGVTLLDPSFAEVMEDIPNTGVLPGLNTPLSEYVDVRPVDYAHKNDTVNSAKYIVLMTDGENTYNRRIKDSVYGHLQNADLINNHHLGFLTKCANEEIIADADLHYASFNNKLVYEEGVDMGEIVEDGDLNDPTVNDTASVMCKNMIQNQHVRDTFKYRAGEDDVYDVVDRISEYTSNADDPSLDGFSGTEGNGLLQKLCDAAKRENIVVFTIAMNAPTAGETAMKSCATLAGTDLYYFESTGNDLAVIFDDIAQQITALRLSL